MKFALNYCIFRLYFTVLFVWLFITRVTLVVVSFHILSLCTFLFLEPLQYSFLKCDDRKCLQYSKYRHTKVVYKNRDNVDTLSLLLPVSLQAPRGSPEHESFVGSFVCCSTWASSPQGWSSSFPQRYSSYCLNVTNVLCCCKKIGNSNIPHAIT